MDEETRGFQQRVGAWGEATFPTSTLQTICAHLQEEARELSEACEEYAGNLNSGYDVLASVDRDLIREECADVFLLLQHLAHRLDFDLRDEAEAKFERCKLRTWAVDPERGYARHVEEVPDAS